MKIFTFKSLFVALMMLCGVAANAQSFYVEPFSIKPGEEKTFAILLDSKGDGFSSYQFDVYLPEGITFKLNKAGRPIVNLNATLKDENDIYAYTSTPSIMADGSLRIIGYSTFAEPIPAEIKEIYTITVVASEGLAPSVYKLSIKNMELARPDATNVRPADATTEITVVCDETGIEEVMGEAATGKAIHDILGRKVNKITTPGIYVINGKKTFVK